MDHWCSVDPENLNLPSTVPVLNLMKPHFAQVGISMSPLVTNDRFNLSSKCITGILEP